MVELIYFASGVILGGLISWWISHRYYLKANADQKAEVERLKADLRPRTTLQDFEQHLVTGPWQESHINHTQTWICDADNTFQIRVGERRREFNERWTTVHPDSHSGAAYPVYLYIGNVAIKEVTFISMDGGRIFVPMASLRPAQNAEVEYFWNLSSLEIKVCRIIGTYYIYKDLEGVARRSRVALVE